MHQGIACLKDSRGINSPKISGKFCSNYCYSLVLSSSMGRMSICGFFKTCLFAILRSNESNSEGSRIKLAIIANRRVAETNAPKATVPPKLEMTNTENPKKRTIDV